jgi:hypothetical protein
MGRCLLSTRPVSRVMCSGALSRSRITVKFGFFTIAAGPAVKVLSDGRNAHLIQKPTSWWLPKLVRHFEIDHLQHQDAHGFWVIVKPVIK